MRYLDILHVITENRQQYLQMLQPLVTLGLMSSSNIQELANQIRQKLKRNDRITWWLRNYRLFTLQEYVRDALRQLGKNTTISDEQYAQEEDRLLSLFKKITGVDYHTVRVSDTNYFLNEFGIESTDLNHYAGMFDLSPDVNNVQWDPTANIHALTNALNRAEKVWKERQSQLVNPEGRDTIVIDYGKTAWMLLPRSYCDAEGKAMGHCGNAGDPKEGDRILSYRTKEANNQFRPHLTFVLHKDGWLGEMKGRNNQKPDSKYHAIIVDLLKNSIVKGIRGGGYKPENNFQISDLPEQLQDQLIEEKPGLADLNTLFRRQGMTDEIKQQVEELVEEYTTTKPRWLDKEQKLVFGPFKKFSDFSNFIWGPGGKANIRTFTQVVDLMPVRTQDDDNTDYTDNNEISEYTRKKIRDIYEYKDDTLSYQSSSWQDVYKELSDEGEYETLLRKIGLPVTRYYSWSDLAKKSPQFAQAYEKAIADAYADYYYRLVSIMLGNWLSDNRDKVYKIRNSYSAAIDYSRVVEKTQLARSAEFPPPSLWFFVGPHPGHKFPNTVQKLPAYDIVEKLLKELK